MTTKVITFIFLCFSVLQCQKEADDFIDLIKDAPEKLTISTDTLILDSYIWRDFQPTIIDPENPPDIQCKNGLNCVVKLKETNGQDIQDHLTLTKIYIFKRRDFWESEVKSRESNSIDILEGGAGCGPHWDTGIKVDVVLEFSSNKDNSKYYIRQEKQEINETS